MELRVSNLQNDIRIISLSGRLDLNGTLGIEKLFSLHTLGAMSGKVIVDLHGVEYLASSGICMLLRSARELHERRGRMVIMHPLPAIEEVLHVGKVDTQVKIARSLEEAELMLAEPAQA